MDTYLDDPIPFATSDLANCNQSTEPLSSHSSHWPLYCRSVPTRIFEYSEPSQLLQFDPIHRPLDLIWGKSDNLTQTTPSETNQLQDTLFLFRAYHFLSANPSIFLPVTLYRYQDSSLIDHKIHVWSFDCLTSTRAFYFTTLIHCAWNFYLGLLERETIRQQPFLMV